MEPVEPTEEPAEPNAARRRGLPLRMLGAAMQEPNVEPVEPTEEPAEPNTARCRGLCLFEVKGRPDPQLPPACRWWCDGEGGEAPSST